MVDITTSVHDDSEVGERSSDFSPHHEIKFEGIAVKSKKELNFFDKKVVANKTSNTCFLLASCFVHGPLMHHFMFCLDANLVLCFNLQKKRKRLPPLFPVTITVMCVTELTMADPFEFNASQEVDNGEGSFSLHLSSLACLFPSSFFTSNACARSLDGPVCDIDDLPAKGKKTNKRKSKQPQTTKSAKKSKVSEWRLREGVFCKGFLAPVHSGDMCMCMCVV